ncbi:protein FAM13A isoform X2 [Danio rerio]|uniref:Protein FAM13A isoform X2 n=2 Tax=Danio rerio TaxID=7955 RepID=A0AB32TB46_DANRE
MGLLCKVISLFCWTTSDDSDSVDSCEPAFRTRPVFGVCLQRLRNAGQMRQGVPAVLMQMVEFLEQYGLHQRELFCVSGSEAEREALRQRLDRGEIQFFSKDDVHAVASLLILFLKELPHGLIPDEDAKRLLRVYAKTRGKGLNLRRAKKVLESYPPDTFNILSLLFHFLSRVAAQSRVNHMTSERLAKVFGPCIFHVRSVPDSSMKQVELELCVYLTQHLIDSVTILLPNMYPPKPKGVLLCTGDGAAVSGHTHHSGQRSAVDEHLIQD